MLAGKGLIQCSSVSRQQTRILGHLIAPSQGLRTAAASYLPAAPHHPSRGTLHDSSRRLSVSVAASQSASAPSTATADAKPMAQEVAILGGGCFWCVEACYNQLKGIHSALSGYAGGHVENPTYEEVCGKKTGHAEVVQVTYDPSIIDYGTILRVFFTIHDPTTKDRQGNDVGPQYRSIIMYTSEEQKKIAEQIMQEVTDEKLYSAPLVTELVPASKFYEAEGYHQRYYEQNPNQGYCSFVVGPKVNKFRAKWKDYLNPA